MLNKILRFDLIVSTIFINIFSLALPLYVIQALTRYLNHGISETLYVLTIGTFFAIVLELFLRNYRIIALEAIQLKDNTRTINYFQKISEIDFENKNLKLIKDLPQRLKKYRIFSSNNEINNILNLLDSPFIIIHLIIIYLLSKAIFILFILFIIISYLIKIFTFRKQIANKKELNKYRDKNHYLEKSFLNDFHTISLYTSIKSYFKKFEEQEKKISQSQKRNFTSFQKIEFNQTFMKSLLTMFVIFIACISIYNGKMEIGVLIALNILIAKTYTPLINFYDLLNNINNSALDRDFNSLLELYPKRNGKIILKKCKGKIELKKITLQYPEHKIPIFENLSLKFESGSVTAITGENGIGKSTLFRIITGVQKPDVGEILIDDTNIEQIKQEHLNKNFVSVTQDPVFFEGTIRENLLSVNQSITDNDIISTIENFDLYKYLGKTENGIDTTIDFNTSKFSLGIKKRLGLARASLTNGSIIIFDEPTEGLDREGANIYYKYLNEAKQKNKTIIILSHDNELIKGANNIINLNNLKKPDFISKNKFSKVKND